MKILIIRALLGILLIAVSDLALTQEKKEIVWHTPTESAIRAVHNQLWHGSEINSFFDRLPAKAQNNVRREVWDLSKNAAGLKLVFNTDASEIVIRYTLANKNYAMPHFAATGVSGIDLYAKGANDTWFWANGTYYFKDTIVYKYSNLSINKDQKGGDHEFHLYLPLYNSVKWLQIGVPKNSTVQFQPVSKEKPIVVYGTSIAQGGCASRAGMAWTNILNRFLNIPIVNLGFSGNGRLETELIDLLVAQEAQIYILDCLPNMSEKDNQLKNKILNAVNGIRAKYTHTPIILADHSAYLDNSMHPDHIANIISINKISFDAYTELESKGIKELYYLTNKEIGLDMFDTVDGIHPTDRGMYKYAIAYKNLINKIMHKGHNRRSR